MVNKNISEFDFLIKFIRYNFWVIANISAKFSGILNFRKM